MNSLLESVRFAGLRLREVVVAFRARAAISWVLLAFFFQLYGVSASCGASLQLLSKPDGLVTQASTGNGDSVSPWLSADGRFVMFSSAADNLVTNDSGTLGLNVFLRDRLSNATVLVSVASNGSGGGNGVSISVCASSNGQFTLFQSEASDLVADDTNGGSDIFVRDVVGGITRLVSVSTNGGVGDGVSADPVMTGDGRFVAFISASTNLVVDDTNGITDVFVRDMVNQTTSLASVGAVLASGASNAASDSLSITPDGRFVAFFSSARGLVAGVTNTSRGEIYVRDLVGGTTTWVSSNATALVRSVMQFTSEPVPSHPVISDDGRFVAFKSGWTNGTAAPGGTTAATVIMQFDFTTALTTIVATNGLPPWVQNTDVNGPEMTPDGRFIAFVATNKQPAALTVRLWDAQTGSNTLVSVAQDGSFPTNSVSDSPAVSADGRFVAFVSSATNLTGNLVSNGFHIYLRDMQAGTNQLIDADTNGVGSFECVATIPSLSTNGLWVAFSCREGGAVSGINNRSQQVFVRDVAGATNELISRSHPGVMAQSGNGLSSLAQFSLSDDGRRVAFASSGSDLVPNDANNGSDAFIHDLTAGSNILASVGIDGNAATGGDSYSPALGRDGRFIVFVSTATNLVAGRTNWLSNVYLRDLLAGTNALVSVSTNGVSPGSGMAYSPSVSQSGRHVIFLSSAPNLAAGGVANSVNVYLRDMTLGTTVRLTNGVSTGSTPSLSADGRYAAFFGPSAQLWVWDTQLGTRVFTNLTAVTSAALSPTGARLLYTTSTALFAVNLLNNSNLFSLPTRFAIRNPSAWSVDGRYFTFVTATNALAADVNGTNDVYLCDLASSSLTLISVNSNLTASANGIAEWPAVSGDGRFVVYRSFATDVVPGANSSPNIFLFDRLTGSNSLLTATAGSWNSRPAVNGDGRFVVFQSWSSCLVTSDLNHGQDVFGAALLPWGSGDSDGDGLPDLWTTRYFGHPTGQAVDFSRASDDADNDGMSNLEEFLAGTNPLDAASVLRVQISLVISPDRSAVLNWLAVPGKSYRVQFKNSVSDPAWVDVPGAMVIGTLGAFVVPADEVVRFYRVVAN